MEHEYAPAPEKTGDAVKNENKGKNKGAFLLLALLLLVFLASAVYTGFTVYTNVQAESQYGEILELATKADGGSVTPQAEGNGYSPINLSKLRCINPDVYAWLRVPGTNIDYPVVQSVEDDNYYLHRNIYRRYFFAGMIYTQSGNYKDFYDPITVIYGHNMRNDTMFSTLLYFEKADFFKKNEYFYIYTLDRVLTYRIVSAYRYDNRHLLNAFDFYDPKVLADYQKGIVNPISTLRNVRDGITLDENSKIVTLSTCMPNDKKHRFLVNGVLISDIPIQE